MAIQFIQSDRIEIDDSSEIALGQGTNNKATLATVRVWDLQRVNSHQHRLAIRKPTMFHRNAKLYEKKAEAEVRERMMKLGLPVLPLYFFDEKNHSFSTDVSQEFSKFVLSYGCYISDSDEIEFNKRYNNDTSLRERPENDHIIDTVQNAATVLAHDGIKLRSWNGRKLFFFILDKADETQADVVLGDTKKEQHLEIAQQDFSAEEFLLNNINVAQDSILGSSRRLSGTVNKMLGIPEEKVRSHFQPLLADLSS